MSCHESEVEFLREALKSSQEANNKYHEELGKMSLKLKQAMDIIAQQTIERARLNTKAVSPLSQESQDGCATMDVSEHIRTLMVERDLSRNELNMAFNAHRSEVNTLNRQISELINKRDELLKKLSDSEAVVANMSNDLMRASHTIEELNKNLVDANSYIEKMKKAKLSVNPGDREVLLISEVCPEYNLNGSRLTLKVTSICHGLPGPSIECIPQQKFRPGQRIVIIKLPQEG